MKIYLRNGATCLEAETIEEVAQLIELKGVAKEKEKSKRGEYRVHRCEICGKSFKRLNMHMRLVHVVPVQSLSPEYKTV